MGDMAAGIVVQNNTMESLKKMRTEFGVATYDEVIKELIKRAKPSMQTNIKVTKNVKAEM